MVPDSASAKPWDDLLVGVVRTLREETNRRFQESQLHDGTIAKSKLKSEILNTDYSINIYTPPNYEKDGRQCWLAVAFDEGFLSMQPTLDNLLASGRILPIVVVGVKNINRERNLGCSDE